ncbi:phage tail family protein [Listeria booriae]|uniref:phage tail domain-containing protein n=1 Tax=Listeria booriae TaxID=1552123 RepID=UPI0016252E61|nr:phage tail domain-containing protein [Listeria booriae]MBC2369379.1 phage tail family protein [Listeria booriae]
MMRHEVIFLINNEPINFTGKSGIHALDYELNDVNTTNDDIEMFGMDGVSPRSKNFGPFDFKLKFYFDGRYDKHLALREIRSLVHRREYYYVTHSFMPGMKFAVNRAAIEVEELSGTDFLFYITFTCFKGCAESLLSTLSDFTVTEKSWQFGQNLVSNNYQYKHTRNKFPIYNAGDLTVNPRQHYLSVTVKCESEGNLQIANLTTGDTFIYNQPITLADTLTIENAIPKMNGVACGRDTNHRLLSLKSGENLISIEGASSLNTEWDFYYLYK